jgi:small subunit ribosomal protein S29e/phospholipase B1
VSGAKAQDLDHQVTRLIEQLDHHPSYKALKSQWKVITLLVGANNVCVLCTPPFTQLPGMADVDLFETHVRSTLDRLHHQVGKSFVNLVALFNVNRNIIAYTHENRLT